MIKPTRIREIDVDMLFNMKVWLELDDELIFIKSVYFYLKKIYKKWSS